MPQRPVLIAILLGLVAVGASWAALRHGRPAPTDVRLPTSVAESFAHLPDGPAPARLPDDSPVTDYSVVAAGHLVVRRGALSTASPGRTSAGSYRIAHLAGSVERVSATFSFTAWTAVGGAFAISVQQTDISRSDPVPVSPLHLVISPVGWGVDVNTEAGTGVDPVVGAAFATPLATGRRTRLEVSATLDRAAGELRLRLPDGSARTVSDPAFSLPGSYVYVEAYKDPAGPTAAMTSALVRSWSARS